MTITDTLSASTVAIDTDPMLDYLSGDRLPLLFRFSSYDPHRYLTLASVSDLQLALPDLLRFFSKAEQIENLELLVDNCLDHIGLDINSVRPDVLLSLLYQNLRREDDAEGYIVSSALFARIQDPRVVTLPTRTFLQEIVRRYLDAASYLVPVLYRYAVDAMAISRMVPCHSILLFLRDALLFWPCLRALRGTNNPLPLNFLVYTRPLREAGQSPILFHEYGDGQTSVDLKATVTSSLVLDVGLYGTLIQDLCLKHFFTGANTVFFFGSRNPHLLGFLNREIKAKKQNREPVDQQLIVRYVDTVECLLKPFQIPMGSNGRVQMEIGDPISFICSTALLWTLSRFSSANSHHQMTTSTSHFSGIPIPSRDSWFLSRPIPTWSKAKEFIEHWSVDNITPVEVFPQWPQYRERHKERRTP